MIDGADFLKWLEAFNIKSGGGAASGTVNSGTANQIAYYATTGNAVSGLTTANNGVLITSAAGVPSISSTLPTTVQTNITRLGTIAQSVVITGSVTPSQTGGIIGTTTNNSANTGSVGEYLESFVSSLAPVSLTAGVDTNITSLPIGAGDWDIWANIGLRVQGGVTVLLSSLGGLNTTSGSLPGGANRIGFDYGASGIVPVNDTSTAYNVKALRQLSSSPTTIYLVVNANFTTGTCAAYGGLAARRRR